MFNEDLLTWCRKPQSKRQHIEQVLLLDIINEKEEYKVKVQNHRKWGHST